MDQNTQLVRTLQSQPEDRDSQEHNRIRPNALTNYDQDIQNMSSQLSMVAASDAYYENNGVQLCDWPQRRTVSVSPFESEDIDPRSLSIPSQSFDCADMPFHDQASFQRMLNCNTVALRELSGPSAAFDAVGKRMMTVVTDTERRGQYNTEAYQDV